MADEELRELLQTATAAALSYHASLPERRVRAPVDIEAVIANLDPEQAVPRVGRSALQVLQELLLVAEPGLTAMNGPRFFGWVVGGTQPAALAADWMCTAWDQNGGTVAGAPAAAAFEVTAVKWAAQLLGLPQDVCGGLVTGATMANFVALAAARNHVLSAVGWDVEQQGLFGAPNVAILAGHERHETIDKAVRLLGFGKGAVGFVGSDGQGRIEPASLAQALAKRSGPFIVCTQAGNVNSGSFDRFLALHEVIQARRNAPDKPTIWWHIDGAFGIWARACPGLAQLALGAELADSWSTDGHKMLNLPYDCGLVFTRHAIAHRRAMAIQGPYLSSGEEPVRLLPAAFAPELSRRARGFALWAGIRALGADGLADLVLRLHRLAQQLAQLLNQVPGAVVLNDVVFNQVVVAFFELLDAEANSKTRQLCVAIQAEGTCYPTPTVWRGRAALRFSVTNATTTAEDIVRSAEAVRAVGLSFTG